MLPKIVKTHSVTRNGMTIDCQLWSDGTGSVYTHAINPKTGKPLPRRGRVYVGKFETHLKAMAAWTKLTFKAAK